MAGIGPSSAQNLSHHPPLAVNEIPEEYIIPPVIRITDESLRVVADMMENPPEPTPEMRELMTDK